jgi:hypothetical protein
LNEKLCIPVPYASPEILPVMVSGLTASIALEQCGNLKIGKTVLVTAGFHFKFKILQLLELQVNLQFNLQN